MMLFAFVLIILLALLCVVFRQGLRNITNRSAVLNQVSVDRVEAYAVLLNISKTGSAKNNEFEYSLQMQVQPIEGRNFVTEMKQMVKEEDVCDLCIGSKLRVRYNPANKKDIALIKTSIDHVQQFNKP